MLLKSNSFCGNNVFLHPPPAGGLCSVYKEFSWLSHLLKPFTVCIFLTWKSLRCLHVRICHVQPQSHFFLLKVNPLPTSDMNGTCLSLPGVKIDLWEDVSLFGCWPCGNCFWYYMSLERRGSLHLQLCRTWLSCSPVCLFFAPATPSNSCWLSKNHRPAAEVALFIQTYLKLS